MCEYIRDAGLMATIAQEQPLVGQRLGDVLDWDRPLMGPACYCESDARRHKWGLVLETMANASLRIGEFMWKGVAPVR